jgi:hypothetical protein
MCLKLLLLHFIKSTLSYVIYSSWCCHPVSQYHLPHKDTLDRHFTCYDTLTEYQRHIDLWAEGNKQPNCYIDFVCPSFKTICAASLSIKLKNVFHPNSPYVVNSVFIELSSSKSHWLIRFIPPYSNRCKFNPI